MAYKRTDQHIVTFCSEPPQLHVNKTQASSFQSSVQYTGRDQGAKPGWTLSPCCLCSHHYVCRLISTATVIQSVGPFCVFSFNISFVTSATLFLGALNSCKILIIKFAKIRSYGKVLFSQYILWVCPQTMPLFEVSANKQHSHSLSFRTTCTGIMVHLTWLLAAAPCSAHTWRCAFRPQNYSLRKWQSFSP